MSAPLISLAERCKQLQADALEAVYIARSAHHTGRDEDRALERADALAEAYRAAHDRLQRALGH